MLELTCNKARTKFVIILEKLSDTDSFGLHQGSNLIIHSWGNAHSGCHLDC